METRQSYDGFAYWGDCEGWGIAYAMHRDSGALDRSNFKAILTDLQKRFGEDDVTVERSSHFLVGWADTILVRPESEAWEAAEEWLEKLDDYPAADEDDWSEEESREALESAAEFVRCELPYTLREHAEDVAGFILNAYSREGTYGESDWCSPGGWWPVIDKTSTFASERDIEYHRDTVAAGVRAWRNYRKQST